VTSQVIVAFADAFLDIPDERGVGAFTVSLMDFAREVGIALNEFDHYG
jgi:hypothetical protein